MLVEQGCLYGVSSGECIVRRATYAVLAAVNVLCTTMAGFFYMKRKKVFFRVGLTLFFITWIAPYFFTVEESSVASSGRAAMRSATSGSTVSGGAATVARFRLGTASR